MGLALFLTDTAHEKNIKTAYYELQNWGRVRSCLYCNTEQTNPMNMCFAAIIKCVQLKEQF